MSDQQQGPQQASARPPESFTISWRGWVKNLVHAARHLQRCRIGAKSTNRRLPQFFGWRVEDEIAVDVAHEPRRGFELRFELARAPTGVSHAEPGNRRPG